MTDTDVRAKFGAGALMGHLGQPAEADLQRAELSEQAREIAGRFSDHAVSPQMVSGILRLVDFVMIIVAGVVALHATIEAPMWTATAHLVPLITAPLLGTLFLQAMDAYNSALFYSLFAPAGRALAGWTLIFAGFALVLYLMSFDDAPMRNWFAAWYGVGVLYMLVSRSILSLAVQRWKRDGRFQRRAVIVGGGNAAAELIRSIESTPTSNVQICGIFDDRAGDRSPDVVQGYPKLGTIAELVAFGRIAKIDMLIVALPVTAETRLLQILKKLWVLPVDIRLSAHADKLRFRPRSYSYLGTVPLLDVIERPIADWDSIVKRAFDVVFASLALILLSPVMLATAVAIKIDSRGPILFRQKRYGFNNEVIDVFKFRSMYTEACDYEAKVAVTKGDPRVTPVGRFIRKTSIDELPQLFNVIVGNLSLVGPRPHAVGSNTANALWEQVIDGYFARHKVKPGVTGWAQVHGWRGEVDTPEKLRGRVEHDLYYIENWSPLLDLWILAYTPFALLNTKNAY